jgi:hypothetical protein
MAELVTLRHVAAIDLAAAHAELMPRHRRRPVAEQVLLHQGRGDQPRHCAGTTSRTPPAAPRGELRRCTTPPG